MVKVKEVFCPQTAATKWHFYQGLEDSVSKWYLLVVEKKKDLVTKSNEIHLNEKKSLKGQLLKQSLATV